MIPDIPKGFATKLGALGTAVLAVVAVLQPFVADNAAENGNARIFAALATLMAVATILGRMMQAAAALRDAPSPAQVYEDPDFVEDVPEEIGTTHVPSEADLAEEFPGDPPARRPGAQP